MKVVYDGIISSLQKNGGVTVYFRELISRIPSSDYILFQYDTKQGDIGKNDIILPSRTLERYRDFFASELIDNTNLENAIFHSSYYRIPRIKLPTVTTVHDFTYERFIKGPARWVHSWQKNRALKNSDLIICVSENTAKDLQSFCAIPDNKIRVIHNGVSEEYHPLDKVSEKSNEVIFIGARSGYKNFRQAVLAVSKVTYLSLTIIGGGALTNEESTLLENYLKGRYNYLGHISNADLNVYYNRAYALLYPSSYEGFGIPILEAMKAGCPVVAVNNSSIPEVAGNAAILVDKIGVNELVEGLHSIEKSRAKLVIDGIRQAEKFSWNLCYKHTMDVYKELIK